MKKKLIIGLVVLLAVGGFAAKTFLLKPKVVKPKIAGTVYVLPKSFTLNLADGRYATLTAALQLAPGQSDGASADGGSSSDSSTGIGTLPEEAVVRSIITNVVAGQSSSTLNSAGGRARLESEILTDINSQTDVKVKAVYFADYAVQ